MSDGELIHAFALLSEDNSSSLISIDEVLALLKCIFEKSILVNLVQIIVSNIIPKKQ
jgi:hypothetical protein